MTKDIADLIYTIICFNITLQCFDAVGWVAGRASGQQKNVSD